MRGISRRLGKLSKLGVASVLVVFASVGCGGADTGGEDALSVKNFVKAGAPVDRRIGEGKNAFRVIDGGTLSRKLASSAILAPKNERATTFLSRLANREKNGAGVEVAPPPRAVAEPKEDALVAGFSANLLDERYVFGGVVTKVSDAKSESLGRLKLTDLPPVHVRTLLAKTADGYALALAGCAKNCGEGAQESVLIAFPVVGVDEKKNEILVDLSAVGSELDIMGIIDPSGLYSGLKTETAKAVAFDYSLSTLVFDVQSTMVPLFALTEPTEDEKVKITARWYLKLMSSFEPSFEPRLAAPGVGFFMTERSKQERITRWAKPAAVKGMNMPLGVKYYIKNVPAEYQKSFSDAFDSWNKEFTAITGKNLFRYEFVKADDERAEVLVPGDVRYNILEWDIENAAPYGGLGPSIANQHTGEIFSANVLIQGPRIVELYKAWFKASGVVRSLEQQGDVVAARRVQKAFVKRLQAVQKEPKGKLVAKAGELALRVTAQMPQYRDPLAARDEFELPPEGLSYAEYMHGYFLEMVAHEIGHNIGLRHNFRGNLSHTGMTEGGVSHSIMEYLGKGFRHLNRIGSYDRMALQYGYDGKKPARTGDFCTDENVADGALTQNSAECSRDDATDDPFGYFAGRLQRAIDFTTGFGSPAAPAWNPEELEGVLYSSSVGVSAYAASAETTGDSWTNFYGKDGRPADASGVREYVLKVVHAQLCGGRVKSAIDEKEGEDAKKATTENVEKLRTIVGSVLGEAAGYTEEEVACPAGE